MENTKTLSNFQKLQKKKNYLNDLNELTPKIIQAKKEAKQMKKISIIKKEASGRIQEYELNRSEMATLRKNDINYTTECPRIATNAKNIEKIKDEKLKTKILLGKKFAKYLQTTIKPIRVSLTEYQRNACYYVGIDYSAAMSYRGRWRYTDYHYISIGDTSYQNYGTPQFYLKYEIKTNFFQKIKKLEKEIEKLETTSTSPEDNAKNFIEKNGKKKATAIALYNLNKIAKTNRDKAEKAYNKCYETYEGEGEDGGPCNYSHNIGNGTDHRALHSAKDIKNTAYYWKDKFLSKMSEIWDIQPIGFHEFADADRDYYELCDFGFHSNENNSEKNLGKIENYIEAKRKKIKHISLTNSIAILELSIN